MYNMIRTGPVSGITDGHQAGMPPEPATVDPQTRVEWQTAVDAAQFFLAIDLAGRCGLLTGGPQVDRQRCEQILRRGRAQGVEPTPDLLRRAFLDGQLRAIAGQMTRGVRNG